jgi:molybdopterin synthase catalytic subunit
VTIRVRLFAIQRELTGTRELTLTLPEGATVEDAWEALAARYPVLAPGRPALRFARNGSYVEPTAVLVDGDELACIPPVSGGASPDGDGVAGRDGVDGGREGGRRRILRLQEEPLSWALVEELAEGLATPADGAVVVFIGRTRVTPGPPAPGQEPLAAALAGQPVEALAYEAHEEMAARLLETIADEAEARFGVSRLAVVHRLGRVPLGEPAVVVVAAAPHREAAFGAARYLIDETKDRVPIWKAEVFADGHVWVGQPPRAGPGDSA